MSPISIDSHSRIYTFVGGLGTYWYFDRILTSMTCVCDSSVQTAITKIREEESAQSGSSGSTGVGHNPHMTPGEAILLVNKMVQSQFKKRGAGIDDPDPEFNRKSRKTSPAEDTQKILEVWCCVFIFPDFFALEFGTG